MFGKKKAKKEKVEPVAAPIEEVAPAVGVVERAAVDESSPATTETQPVMVSESQYILKYLQVIDSKVQELGELITTAIKEE